MLAKYKYFTGDAILKYLLDATNRDANCAATIFFQFLHDADEHGLKSSGTLHCEAYLASFLKHSKDRMIHDGTSVHN